MADREAAVVVGGISKLTLYAYTDPLFTKKWADASNPMSVPINPEKYSQRMAAEFTKPEEIASSGDARVYSRECGAILKLALVFDGTGAVAGSGKASVQKQIQDLRRMGLMVNGDAHEPNYLKLSWGSLLFKGRLQSLDIAYTLFKPDGTPLRAKVDASFVGFHDNKDTQAELKLSSPDLTHLVTVMPGDTLPMMCERIYGDSGYYREVAAANGLDGFRRLRVGSELAFPPLAGAGG
jgi:nucleoid-associated protein YgaU